jgi:hypothetical protein
MPAVFDGCPAPFIPTIMVITINIVGAAVAIHRPPVVFRNPAQQLGVPCEARIGVYMLA